MRIERSENRKYTKLKVLVVKVTSLIKSEGMLEIVG